MNRLNALLAISVAILLTFPVFQVRGLMPDFTIAHEPYQWDKDMKRLKITTPERGLTFKITISNEDTSEPISIENMRVNAKAYYGTEEYQKFFKQVSIDFIYLPPNEVFVLFVPVDFGHGDIVGDYRAEVTYDFGYGTPQKIEPFPFEFRVLSEEIFHQEVEQTGDGGLTITIPIEITIGGPIVSISIIALAIYLWRRKKE